MDEMAPEMLAARAAETLERAARLAKRMASNEVDDLPKALASFKMGLAFAMADMDRAYGPKE